MIDINSHIAILHNILREEEDISYSVHRRELGHYIIISWLIDQPLCGNKKLVLTVTYNACDESDALVVSLYEGTQILLEYLYVNNHSELSKILWSKFSKTITEKKEPA